MLAGVRALIHRLNALGRTGDCRKGEPAAVLCVDMEAIRGGSR